jgi:hypothetical protein
MPGIRRSNPLKLPPRVYQRGRAFYYVTFAGKWIQLGKEWNLVARVKWADLAGESMPQGSVSELLREYRVKVVPTKARRTQADNLEELDRLELVFGRMAVSDLKLRHAAAYLKERGAPVRANREIALFAHAIRWGMNEGLVELERHPFGSRKSGDGLMFNKERPRTRLVNNEEFDRYLGFARAVCPPVAAVIWLMDLTGQRRVDLLAMRRSACKAEGLEVIQSKRGAKLLLEWTDELRAAVAYAQDVHRRELERKNVAGLFVLCTRDGQGYTDSGIKTLQARTMRAAMDVECGPPVVTERFRQQDIRPKAVSDVGGGKRGKDLAGHRTQATTDRVYDRVAFRRVKPTR